MLWRPLVTSFLGSSFVSDPAEVARNRLVTRALSNSDWGVNAVNRVHAGQELNPLAGDSVGPSLDPADVLVRYVYDGGKLERDSRLVSMPAPPASTAGYPCYYASDILAALERDGVDFERFYATAFESGSSAGAWVPLLRDQCSFTNMDTVMEPRELGPQFDFAPRTDGRKGRVDIKLYRRDLGVPKGALNMDGFFGVGIVGRHKTTQNVGSLWRSAFQLGASFIFTVGHKYKSFEATDTLVVHKRLPLIEHADWASFTQASPRGATWVAVTVAAVDGEEAEPAKVDALVAENAAAAAVLVTATTTITSDCSVSSAEPLATFQHPLRAVYVLGSDDSGLPLNVAVACHKHVVLPATRNGPFNVAMAGSVVLYDRLAKQQQQAEAKLGVKPRRKFNSSPK